MFDDTLEEHEPIITDADSPPPGISGFGESLDEVFANDDFSLLSSEALSANIGPTDTSEPSLAANSNTDFPMADTDTDTDTDADVDALWDDLEPLEGDAADIFSVNPHEDISEAARATTAIIDQATEDDDLDAFLEADLAFDDDNQEPLSSGNTHDMDFDDPATNHLDPFGADDLGLFEPHTELDIAADDSGLDMGIAEAAIFASEVTDAVATDDFAADDFAVDDFADLDALLDDDTSGEAGITIADAEDGDDFAELDALLSNSEDVDASAAAPVGKGSSDSEDDFADLEKLLEDADQSMGGPPKAKSDPRQSPVPARRPSPRGISNQTMRVSVKNLDDLNNMVGELVVNRNSLEQSQERLRQFLDNLLYQVHQLSDVGQRMRDLYERSLLESSLLSSRRNYQQQAISSNSSSVDTFHATGASFDALEMDRFTGFHTLSQEMIELIVRVRESASDIDFVVDETDQVTRMFRQVTTQLQEGLTRTRMVSFAQAADRLPRAVRDISIKCGKQAQLVIEGRDTLIDKMILEQLYDPMTHLVNNAITHGIETPEDRVEQDKNPVGTITIRSFHQGNQTIISVMDDGGGIDPEVVKQKAVVKGLITAQEAETISRLDVYDLLFHHGFSTRDKADDFAGRGVGMDVVRTSLSEIRGVISIDSTIGQGTTFTIRLPLTLSISKALLCISNRASIAFPMDGVEDMLDIPKDRVQVNEQGQSCIFWRDILLPFRPLSDLLKFNRSLGRRSVYGGGPEDDVISVIVLRSAGNYLALQVDQVIGEQEIVIKQLESPVPKPAGIAGATVLGDGRIMPIADVLELIDLSMGRIRRESGSSLWEQDGSANITDMPTTANEPTVLIVDDSITVRELLSMTFNKVGYRVEQARDGQEAWEKLRSGLPCDLVFCDIEMPRMDGLELLSRLQKDSNFNHLPIAMLTSRGADRHRQMAVQLGAKGYFTKPYLEEALLDAAQRMLKGEVLVGADS
ncbi:MAG: hybrid sensor histidine kinase/response regulator [Cyanothece sp. SIO2G6]|nr:hybrid sensor histidine kinase/response regulator [Cyanothece sp. SIO2G6]